MKLRGRITWAFLWRMGLLLGLIMNMYVGLVIVFVRWSGLQGLQSPSPRDLLVEAVDSTEVRDGRLMLEEAVLGKLDRRRGWLQILDENGREVYAYRKPPDFPNRFAVGELETWQGRQEETGWYLYTWHSTRIAGKPYTWVVGLPFDEALLLKEIRRRTRWEGTRAMVPPELLDRVKRSGGWLQILDGNGREVYSHLRPPGQPTSYSPGFFIYHQRYGSHFVHAAEEQSGQRRIFILGIKGKRAGNPPEFTEYEQQQVYRMQERAGDALLVGLLLLVLTVAVLFGRRLGSPVLHMMDWLASLSRGEYREPVNRKGAPRSLNPRTGQLRRSFRIYREVFDALRRLTDTLRRNEEQRRRLEKTREEWIAGVSHDLKTPLSSVKGYAALLAEEKYDWEPEEVRRQARVILDKAAHMEGLIDDLNLTFRLKNNALPLSRKEEDLVELVRRAVIGLANHPRSEGYDIRFDAPDEPVGYPVDARWFTRALDNLLINAVIHNPPGTRIRVSVSRPERDGGCIILIEDNGRGMDEETRSRLFERYFRGTSTAERGGGSGLGMAIAHQLIRAHGGDIRIDSEPGRGTRLEIVLGRKEESGDGMQK
jgi:two-component system OmpR family sensor kinase